MEKYSLHKVWHFLKHICIYSVDLKVWYINSRSFKWRLNVPSLLVHKALNRFLIPSNAWTGAWISFQPMEKGLETKWNQIKLWRGIWNTGDWTGQQKQKNNNRWMLVNVKENNSRCFNAKWSDSLSPGSRTAFPKQILRARGCGSPGTSILDSFINVEIMRLTR